jgi:hypothetical protein
MKKNDMTKIALMGLASGLFVTSPVNANENDKEHQGTLLSAHCGAGKCGAHKKGNYTAARDHYSDTDNQTISGHTITKDQLFSQLSQESKALYQSLDSDGKALALEFASGDRFFDKNEAVRAAAQRIAQDRNSPRL